jgi:hypothetical protein
MAVLARSVGLPSRLVVGYAPGRLDAATGRSVITEAEAHSWPEIYFSGVGWVAFEPTGGRPPNVLPAGSASAPAPEPPALNPSTSQPGWRDFLWLPLVGVAVLVVALWGWVSWRSAQRSRAAALTAVYARLRRSGRRLGAPDWPGLTPGEVAILVSKQVERLSPPGRWEAALAPVESEAKRLVELYARATYGPDLPSAGVVGEAHSLWRTLRWRLWLAGLVRRGNYFRRN